MHFKETIDLLESSSYYYSIIIGMDNRYTYVSPNYNKNFDFINQSLVGKPFYITLHPDDIKICAEVGGKCFENPEQLFPATLRKHDGKGGFIFTQWEFKAVFDDQNNPEGIFCIGYNITEHVDTRNELLTAQTEIEIKTDQLEEIGFMQSHIIRKPLANIMGLINLLAVMDAETNLQQIKDLLAESAKELDNVIKSITDKTV
ncbi:PAS domain S-box protein [Mucilaginibacter polytrichastri]|uniref:PAS domain S-box protein n=2 Tax=Mucilaginibacter polytrichastri TaxID=1302689 RepID=UPI0008E41109|nr:PAS domain S-box protein [Mucilaginibacter polytrichastri]SFT00252.1 PAS domain S-box-containing protein [Mucilaginibacter polytrichastri]